jgi:hypothetical protein
MSGATAAGACETGDAEQREGAGGGDLSGHDALVGDGVVSPTGQPAGRFLTGVGNPTVVPIAVDAVGGVAAERLDCLDPLLA